MKLITNKPYESLFVYFPEIEDVNGWTEGSPAVYDPDVGYISQDTAFYNYSSPPKYFIFSASGGTAYEMYSANGVHAGIFLYDYLNYSSDDAVSKRNSIYNGVIDGESSLLVKEDFPVFFLVAVFPVENDSLSLNTPVRISFSVQPLKTDPSSHYVRDWKNRIDGTCWNVAGKIYEHKCLSEIGRQHKEP